MPTFVLWAKATLENVATFWAPKDHVWHIDVKQAAGSEERKDVEVDPEQEYEVPNSKNATANLLVKFPGDKAPSSLKMASLPIVRPQTADDGDLVPFVAFECRGIEPTAWHPTGGYCATSTSNEMYEVGFQNAEDWAEYDEKSGECMSIGHEIQHEFRLHRGK